MAKPITDDPFHQTLWVCLLTLLLMFAIERGFGTGMTIVSPTGMEIELQLSKNM